jgi:ethanolamine utilization protein EutN
MKTGTVVGRVWATKRLAELPAGALLEVDFDPAEPGGKVERIVAFDVLGCGDGERVLVTQGSVARAYFEAGRVVVDALIIGSLDEPVAQAAAKPAAAARRKPGAK